ncbi:MAG: methyltransferase [Ardenticatenia bacterium]|nr:methyltransferase [Ardenticatenia bacterium]
MAMSSQERVLVAIQHREPDRVPVDLGAECNTGIAAGTYTQLRKRLGIKGKPARVYDVEQMLAWVELPVVDALGVDVLAVPKLVQAYGVRVGDWRSWQLGDGTPVQVPTSFNPVTEEDGSLSLYLGGELVARKAAMSPYFDRMVEFKVCDPLPPVETFSLVPYTDEELEWAQRYAQTLRGETDKALLGESGLALTRWGSHQEFLFTLAADPDYVRAWYHRKVDFILSNIRLYAQAVGDNIDIIGFGEDFGTQKGMMISPEMFNDLVAPNYKRVFDWVRENTSWKIFFHCCGAIYPIIQSLIDCGIDILNPVQTSAVGMDPATLKAEFGDRLTFWGGGVDTQAVLPFGSPAQVRAQVKERIQVFGPGGGFVFNQVHNIQEKVPVENLLAMYEAVKEYGQYPLPGIPLA